MLHARNQYASIAISATVILATICGVACSTATETASIETQVRVLTPALRLTFEASSGTMPMRYAFRRFRFVSEPPHDWPYGTGFAIADRTSGQLLWFYLHKGDYAPHEIRWADFDGDGREDIFFHAGFEDVATTRLYLNRVTSRRFAVSNFAQAYANDDVYAVVVDFDADGRPELIAPEAYPSEDDPCAAIFQSATASKPEWKTEYLQLAKRFDTFNFQFGASAAEYDALELFSKPTIISFGREPSSAAVTRHLRLRRNLIASTLPSLSPTCRARAVEIESYVAELIGHYENSMK
jgi:hypothetical protein